MGALPRLEAGNPLADALSAYGMMGGGDQAVDDLMNGLNAAEAELARIYSEFQVLEAANPGSTELSGPRAIIQEAMGMIGNVRSSCGFTMFSTHAALLNSIVSSAVGMAQSGLVMATTATGKQSGESLGDVVADRTARMAERWALVGEMQQRYQHEGLEDIDEQIRRARAAGDEVQYMNLLALRMQRARELGLPVDQRDIDRVNNAQEQAWVDAEERRLGRPLTGTERQDVGRRAAEARSPEAFDRFFDAQDRAEAPAQEPVSLAQTMVDTDEIGAPLNTADNSAPDGTAVALV